ncbi:decaprenyl-phosphate phosphoribosyltransferase [Limnohabitans sp. MORI2]|uniref:decaprenyl-phosphate phosphoribosyltransferase n=1 Tax=Limnohabitans sp. MORI2 TaxID=1751150 RepID=UPI002377248A|nr:decaprenyl-phosphate phosphoribosyltransferase [Limnohabitans sp. MORI2]BDU57282.1 decaprenyl-phosphate phosphoribosyltransferase [Limnohabitans sp. MORI2]
MFAIVRLCRPEQWIKNLFVLIPLLFSKLFLQADSLMNGISAVILFSLASSATYVLNDFRDIEKDKKHPTKSKKRPLAAGQVSVRAALVLLLILYTTLIVAVFWMPKVMGVVGAYILLNYAYTFFLKHQPVFDVFVIAIGFVLRVYAGGVAIGSGVSHWMFIVTLCLALYLASIKRRQELIKSEDGAREVLGKYTVGLLTRYAELSATCTIVFYSLFIALVRPELALTIPLMLFGLYRYWFCIEAFDAGESPTDALLNDKVLQGTIIIWLGLSAWSLLHGPII